MPTPFLRSGLSPIVVGLDRCPLGEVGPMDLHIRELMDEDACYRLLPRWFHPAGLACPHCLEDDRMAVHRRYREPVIDTAAATASGSSTPSPVRRRRATSGRWPSSS